MLSARRRQSAAVPVDLEAEYKRLFGVTRVLMESIDDHHLCSRGAFGERILPFLSSADAGGERVVIHCWAAMVEPVTCSRPGSSPHEAYPRQRQLRRWKPLDAYHGRRSWRATQRSTN